ncbi:phosphomevalonate kinase [Stomoxys calcitrans]|uniref:Phosphomevalonate kinase n=1 Tax=Stomoxys calcitrans TaxID=35570 RepID=A0A1I8Q4E1_STOCA|nr:phosphomevalonate kinase [Stomoxys calcitrans]
MDNIKHILLISGKRKCGKDYISEKLKNKLGASSQIIRISEPIKSEWAQKMQLDLNQLLSDGPYKEKYRKDMITWSDTVRQQDYGYFCRTAMEKANSEIVIVSDVRRKNDIRYFKEVYGEKVLCIRLSCPDIIRMERGYLFTPGIDDIESECGLDDYDNWDLHLKNDSRINPDQIVAAIIAKMF